MARSKQIAVILFQLGGPDTQAAVERFLRNLFCDPDIINFPGAFLARKTLARLISRSRAKVVREHYAEIGRRLADSPAPEEQGNALEARSSRTSPRAPSSRCATGIRTRRKRSTRWRASRSTSSFCCLLPALLRSTTGSSLKEWNRCYKSKAPAHPDRSLLRSSGLHRGHRRANKWRPERTAESRPGPSCLQRPRLAAVTRREGRSVSESHRHHRGAGAPAWRVAESVRAVLPEPRRPAEMAPAVAYANDRTNWPRTARSACW